MRLVDITNRNICLRESNIYMIVLIVDSFAWIWTTRKTMPCMVNQMHQSVVVTTSGTNDNVSDIHVG